MFDFTQNFILTNAHAQFVTTSKIKTGEDCLLGL